MVAFETKNQSKCKHNGSIQFMFVFAVFLLLNGNHQQ